MKFIQTAALLFLLLSLPINAAASGQSGQFYPPSNSDYFSKKFSWQLYSDKNVQQIRFIQFNLNNKQVAEKTMNVKGNSLTWVDFSCPGTVAIQFLDRNKNIIGAFARGQATSYVNQKTCNYRTFVNISDYNEMNRKYKSDTFKKKARR